MNALLSLLMGGKSADKVVPPTGRIVRQTVFVAAVMSFLSVIALAGTFTANRVANEWASELSQTITLRLPVDSDRQDAYVAAAQEVLRTTPGITSFRVLSADEQATLLEPWFGSDLPLADLPIPQLVEITPDRGAYDPENLIIRLSAQVPGAVLDDHTRWRAPLLAAAQRIQLVGWVVVVLIGLSVAAMITLAAQASLAANAQTIRVLRLVGARDVYIARAFVRRTTSRALGGAIPGAVLGVLAVSLVPAAGDGAGVLHQFGLRGAEWLWPVTLPFVVAIVAFFAARAAAFHQLKEMT